MSPKPSLAQSAKIIAAGSLVGMTVAQCIPQGTSMNVQVTSPKPTESVVSKIKKSVQKVFTPKTLSPHKPIKALWVSRYNPKTRTKADIDRLIKNTAAAGYNRILYQVYGGGDHHTYYKTTVAHATEHPSIATFDSFAYLISEAKKKGIAVEAYILALASKEPILEALGKREEWVLHDENGEEAICEDNYLWLDPEHQEVRTYIKTIVKEILEKYDVDGIHLDRIRLPHKSFVNQERRTAITSLVAEIRAQVHQVSSQKKLTAAVWGYHTGIKNEDGENFLGEGGNEKFAQDSIAWTKSDCSKIIGGSGPCADVIYPMYYYNADHRPDYDRILKQFSTYDRSKVAMGFEIKNDDNSAKRVRAENDRFAGTAIYSYRDENIEGLKY